MAFNPGGGGGISTASDVSLNNVADDNALSYNSTTQKWTNQAITSDTIGDLANAVAAIIGARVVAGANTTVAYNPTTRVTTISSTGGGGGGGAEGSTNVIILASDETAPPANTPVGTIVLREVA